LGVVHVTSVLLLEDKAVAGAGNARRSPSERSFQATGVTTAGAGSATVKIQVSNDETAWLDLGTITLTLSTSAASDGFSTIAPWAFVRANLTAISGTGASVTVSMGY